MHLTGLIDLFLEQPEVRRRTAQLSGGERPWAVVRSARPFFAAALARGWSGPVIFVTSRIKRSYDVSGQVPVWLDSPDAVYRFAEPAPHFFERAPWGDAAIRARLEALDALAVSDFSATSAFVVTSAHALIQRTIPFSTFRRVTITIERGSVFAIDKLVVRLVSLGYAPAGLVIEPGQFSRRGGVLDVFPVTAPFPVRLEFFDDEIDSLRQFDPATQRTIHHVDSIAITPAREALPELMPPVAAHLRAWFEQAENENVPRSDFDSLRAGGEFAVMEHYLPYVYTAPASLLDYAPSGTLVIIEDPDEFDLTLNELYTTADETRRRGIAAGLLPEDMPVPYVSREALDASLAAHTVITLRTGEEPDPWFSPGKRFGGQLKNAMSHMRTVMRDGGRAILVTQQTARVSDVWYQQGIERTLTTVNDLPISPEPGSAVLVNGTLQEGWTLDLAGGVDVLTDAELFGWGRPEQRRRRSPRAARPPESDYADWREGDYVVHVDYGIGQFAGLQHRTLGGVSREYLVVDYAGSDQVYVPIHHADRLSRYIGVDDKPPTIHRLGQQDWLKIAHRARKAAEDEARDLLQLYAARAAAHGFSFSEDSVLQHELEASFPYVETDDQLRALREVKADMEQAIPMDRLICGDVGYGKTEVALRAAFKAVADGKQVAVLVPTTILAQQHHETFSNRLTSMPVRVELMSRFRTKAAQTAVAAEIEKGDVDIVIGTHRILSDDIRFKNLGLVVIDEEQRFGVKQKEHFKKLRTQVDVLTLTATPIPRTLYMTLTGVRDISMIQTPPEERLPVITHTGQFDDALVRQAVLREMERGGQVFFVHNRIGSIDLVRMRLEDIVPEARVITAHGQMGERHLESVIAEFARGEYDILLSTAIIENGIDMPNVNTVIVDRADWFGLSQLYQIRGRVGRGAQQAYAYFFYDSGKLTHEAFARLETLAEHTKLGAGLQIAMRDLEIRGAGDILSTRQTGQVAAVGLTLYTQLLAQAVNHLKGNPDDTAGLAVSAPGMVIDLPIPAYLPDDWIPEMALRLQIYRRIGALSRVDDVNALRDELRDRFGLLPLAVDGLLFQIEVKLLAQRAGATGVQARDTMVRIKLPYLAEVNRDALAERLGSGISVTRTAVEFDQDREGLWRLRLIDVLDQLHAERTTALAEMTGA
ncbi:MAG: transcription-repair coupling factor [Chloroflexi bacterium]|nr:transcription-repair coupling factor [Chloroflexota bacterium]